MEHGVPEYVWLMVILRLLSIENIPLPTMNWNTWQYYMHWDMSETNTRGKI